MTRHDPIVAADRAEEQSAAMSLRSTTNAEDLGLVWSMSCEHFAGDARERLQDVYREVLAKHAPILRAG